MKKGTKEIKHIPLDSIENPDFLRELDKKELDVLASDIREELIDATSKNGGHLSANLGAVEATIALCKVFDFSKDKIIFDVGHQCYTYKILTGRSLERLRQSDGVSGFQKMSESPYDHYEAGHSSTSVAAANGMALVRDLNGEDYNVVAFIGDASIVNGLSFEAINDSAMLKHKIIIVLNDNDMSIGRPVGGVARLFRRFSTSSFYNKSKSAARKLFNWNPIGRGIYRGFVGIKNWFKRHVIKINIFDTIGYSCVGPVDGHNIKALTKAFNRAKKNPKSTVVHIKTIKGKGYKYSENDSKGVWHGVPPFDKETGEFMCNARKTTWSEVYSQALEKFMDNHEDAIVVVPSTGLGSALTNVYTKYKNRIIDVGIAEEYAATLSGSLAVSGKYPVISMYSTFLQRAYDEVSHDLARMNLNATILIDRAGLTGNDGDTHQGIYDEAFLYSIPNTVISMASSPKQAQSLIDESKNGHGVFCIRYPREKMELAEEVENIPFGSWKKAYVNKAKTAIVSVGPESEKLINLIKDKKLGADVYQAIYLKPMDESALKELLSYDRVIIHDAYAVEDGFSKELAAELMVRGYKGQVIIKAVKDVFVSQASIDEQKKSFGVRAEDIIELL